MREHTHGESESRKKLRVKYGDRKFQILVEEKRFFLSIGYPLPLPVSIGVLLILSALSFSIVWVSYKAGEAFMEEKSEQIQQIQ